MLEYSSRMVWRKQYRATGTRILFEVWLLSCRVFRPMFPGPGLVQAFRGRAVRVCGVRACFWRLVGMGARGGLLDPSLGLILVRVGRAGTQGTNQ